MDGRTLAERLGEIEKLYPATMGLAPIDFDTVSLTGMGRVQAFYESHLGRLPTEFEARNILTEELREALEAVELGATPEHILKELCDVHFTVLGYCLARGWNFGGAFDAVVASNMAKPRAPEGASKVPKGPGYVATDLRPYVG